MLICGVRADIYTNVAKLSGRYGLSKPDTLKSALQQLGHLALDERGKFLGEVCNRLSINADRVSLKVFAYVILNSGLADEFPDIKNNLSHKTSSICGIETGSVSGGGINIFFNRYNIADLMHVASTAKYEYQYFLYRNILEVVKTPKPTINDMKLFTDTVVQITDNGLLKSLADTIINFSLDCGRYFELFEMTVARISDQNYLESLGDSVSKVITFREQHAKMLMNILIPKLSKTDVLLVLAERMMLSNNPVYKSNVLFSRIIAKSTNIGYLRKLSVQVSKSSRLTELNKRQLSQIITQRIIKLGIVRV